MTLTAVTHQKLRARKSSEIGRCSPEEPKKRLNRSKTWRKSCPFACPNGRNFETIPNSC